ncbi:MAG: helix-turn-helix domain-containing protein [Verrucomicrobiales bacterium]
MLELPADGARPVLSACVEAIASADPRFSWEMSQRARYRAEVIARADRFMRANLGGRFTSEQLCRWVGMSGGACSSISREALGMSPPKQWLHRLALNQARRFLTKHAPESRPGDQRRAGLPDLSISGRFAKSYRELFGESPSQTVGRRVALG